MVLGRPLSKPPPGSTKAYREGQLGYALLFINDKQATQQVVCDQGCLSKLKVPMADFAVTNLITGEAMPDHKAGQSISVSVPGWGASVYLRLDPK